jgi:glucose-6-phosphate isomerase
VKPWHPPDSEAWQRLAGLAQRTGNERMLDYFDADPQRGARCRLAVAGIELDYSKNRVSAEVLQALLALAEASPLRRRIDAMFAGERINTSEDRAVLHTALRARDGGEHAAAVASALSHMYHFVRRLHAGEYRNAAGERFTDVINIGIGGSDLGPRMVCRALAEFGRDDLHCHFIANVDGADINGLLRGLNPATTLVIVSSKTFTTQETLMNARVAFDWLQGAPAVADACRSNHVLAVTASPEKAQAMGIDPARIFRFWDWVGGRYSLWSSIGLSIAVQVGPEHFQSLLDVAAAMDAHFRAAPFGENMPVLLGLLVIWYHNFLGAATHAVIPYCERLGLLPAYLQQLDMESNGKRVTLDNRPVDYHTGPIVWGQTGTNGQHAFFQLLHQGTHLVPVDMIGAIEDRMSNPEQHRALLANMLAQSAALLRGDGDPAADPQRYYPGNRPSNTLLLNRLTPASLGALLALYEHKVFVQGTIWHINSFDQWGVELGKRMANALLDDPGGAGFDPSTRALLARAWPAARD